MVGRLGIEPRTRGLRLSQWPGHSGCRWSRAGRRCHVRESVPSTRGQTIHLDAKATPDRRIAAPQPLGFFVANIGRRAPARAEHCPRSRAVCCRPATHHAARPASVVLDPERVAGGSNRRHGANHGPQAVRSQRAPLQAPAGGPAARVARTHLAMDSGTGRHHVRRRRPAIARSGMSPSPACCNPSHDSVIYRIT